MSNSTQHAPASGLGKLLETNSILLLLGILLMISVGGLVEIVPLFYLKSTIEQVEGVRPYTPLELAGFNIYIREGCYNLPFADDPAAARRGGAVRPLLARGREHVRPSASMGLEAQRPGPRARRGKYSNDWQRDHMRDPRAVVPSSIMPGYAFLSKTPVNGAHLTEQMRLLRVVGVPYSDEQIDNATVDLAAQAASDDAGGADLQKRYPNAVLGDVAGKSSVTEEDALIAYLQHLGVSVDFKLYDDKANIR